MADEKTAEVQVVLTFTTNVLADGRLQVVPVAGSRPPTLDDLHAVACRMKRDVEMKLTAANVVHQLAAARDQGKNG